MNHASDLAGALPRGARPTAAPAAARALFTLLDRLQVGTLDLQLPDGSQARFGTGVADQPHAAMRLHDWRVCAAVLRSGDIGLAEAYIAGDWAASDLVALLELLIANRDAVQDAVYGSLWGRLVHRLRHLFNRNSRAGSRRNIHAHYDLGNAFYGLWLDPSMSYSSAWFDGNPALPTERAQLAKAQRALAQCGIEPGQRLLEIGCGWGGLAEVAARDFGARVTGVTLSAEQLEHGRGRLQQAGLAGQAELRYQDYRDLADAPYDAIVSIEMFEAVGREYWAGYFQTLQRQLKPGGRACIQSITIRDDLFERYLAGSDFIQQYIFPGGLLPSPQAFRAEAARAGLEVVDELAFGADYAETLRRWRRDFVRREPQVRQLGFDSRFLRTWEFYLAYCEAAFSCGNTDVMQFTLQRR